MPITGPSSYPVTVQAFIAHWEQANAALGASDVVLPDGTTLAAFESLDEDLLAKRAQVQDRLNDREIARGDLDNQKQAMLDRVVQFNEKVRAFFAGSKWIGALPNAPQLNSAQGRFVDPVDDASNLWAKVNADPGTVTPVTLLGGYDQATFATDAQNLKAAFSTLNAADTTLRVTREERNVLQDQIYAVLKSYRLVVPTLFAKDSAIVESMPRLSPLPGHTPEAVVLSGEWDAGTNQASFTWTASSEADLNEYEIRMSPGPTYSSDDESVIGNIPAGDPLAFTTNAGLGTPGLVAGFKVYVKLNTGNEKGSNAVIITHAVP